MSLKLFRHRRNYRGSFRQNHKPKLFYVFWIFFLILGLGLIFFLFNNFFTIKTVTIKLNKINCTIEEEIKNLARLKNMNIFFFDSETVENSLKNRYLCIGDINFSKKLPNEIILDIRNKEPVVILHIIKESESTNSSSLKNAIDIIASPSAKEASNAAAIQVVEEKPIESFLVDKNGVIFSNANEETDMPKLFFYGIGFKLGEQVKEEMLRNSLKIFETLKSFTLDVKEGKIYSQQILLINSKPNLVFNLKGNIDGQLGALQLILEKAKINEETIEFVDLRFEKPVIRFSKKK